MTLQQIFLHFKQALAAQYPDTEIRSFFLLIIHRLKGLSATDLHTKPDYPFSAPELRQLNVMVEQLKRQMPIQYVLGQTTFYNLSFRVNHHVLIPRPETEELVQWVLSEVNPIEQLRILDIGTGSGAIAVSLAANLPQAGITATDISAEALKMAQFNARQNYTTIELVQHNVLTDNFPTTKYNVIVSNPPYVRQLEKSQMKTNVLEYEPETALFVSDDNPLVFYQRIAQLASVCLHAQGQVFVEINRYLAEQTQAVFEQFFKRVELRTDLNGFPRMIKADVLK